VIITTKTICWRLYWLCVFWWCCWHAS